MCNTHACTAWRARVLCAYYIRTPRVIVCVRVGAVHILHCPHTHIHTHTHTHTRTWHSIPSLDREFVRKGSDRDVDVCPPQNVNRRYCLHLCDMTHTYVWYDSFIRVTWLIHACDMTYSYVRHDSSTCATRHIHMRDTTESGCVCVWCVCVRERVCVCARMRVYVPVCVCASMCAWQ